MSINIVIVAGILERLRYSFPEAEPESEPIAKVNRALRPLRERLKQIIEHADANHNIAVEMTQVFGRHMMELLYDFEGVMESCALEFTSRRNGFRKGICKRSSQQIKVIEKLRKDLASMIDRACKDRLTYLELLTHEIENRRSGQLSRPVYTDLIVGMEDAEEDLISALTKGADHLNLVSVCGMAGIGKTTLARKIFERPEIEYNFFLRVWVSVSQEYHRREILQKIYSRLGARSPVDDMPEDELAEGIYRSLKTGRYLIVLDDIWDADAWFSLRMVFPDDAKGSRILITTRQKDVALQVGGPKSHIHMMRPLSDEESLELLRLTLRLEDIAQIEQISKKIISRCGGLPLAITVLASSLTENPVEEWKWHLEHLYRPGPGQWLDNALDLSYKNLPLHLRACLLYLGNYFPEDTEIEVDTVCQLLIAEGLVSVKDKRNRETMIDVAAGYLDELDNRSLVHILEEEVPGQKGFKSCRIHNVIGWFCKNDDNNDGFFEAIDEDKTMSLATRRAMHLHEYECGFAHLYEAPDYLRSLTFFNSSRTGEGYIRPREIPNLGHFIRLRVLCLYALDLKQGKLPKGVENLVHLRYLSFRECYLEELSSSVGNMVYLQTLDLRVRNECQITIPDVLDSLERLKYLYLPVSYRTLNHEKLQLGGLKELELLDNFNTTMCNGEDLLKLTNLIWLTVTIEGDVSEIEKILKFVSRYVRQLRSTSLNLRDFDCYSKEKLSVLEKAFNSSTLDTLGVEGYLNKLPMFDRTSSKLTEIVLNGSELAEDPMQILRDLPSLKFLVLEIEAYIGEKMKCSSGFPELRYLKLSRLYKLQDWEVENKAMPNLRTLIIENCRNLQMLPDGLQFTTNLQKLEIASMPDAFVGAIQKPDGTEGEDFRKIRHVKTYVKVNGQVLILKKEEQVREQGEDPQSSSTLQASRT